MNRLKESLYHRIDPLRYRNSGSAGYSNPLILKNWVLYWISVKKWIKKVIIQTTRWIKSASFERAIGRRWIFRSLFLIWVIQLFVHLWKFQIWVNFRWRFICSIIQISFRGHLVSFSVMYGPLTVSRFEFEIINSWNIGAYLIQQSFASSESGSGPGGW